MQSFILTEVSDSGLMIVIGSNSSTVSSVLQCVAVCCSVLQCVAVCCSVLQCVVFQ